MPEKKKVVMKITKKKRNKEEDHEYEPCWDLRRGSNKEEEEKAKTDSRPVRPNKQMHLAHFVRRNSIKFEAEKKRS